MSNAGLMARQLAMGKMGGIHALMQGQHPLKQAAMGMGGVGGTSQAIYDEDRRPEVIQRVSFEVEEEAALLSQTIKDGMEDYWVEGGLPLPTINSQILSLVIDYCKKHTAASASSEDLDSWDADFVKVEQNTLFDIILAANYLNIRGLLDLACQTVADMIKGKTPDEMRQTFNIRN
ncbi:hypothetical protein MLD38_016760 [Melastoma candidum]|uniref:Uncharacterized protein n=1 Tax=Melastoma candidum TaxID=119954 RepID=A0ACB9QNC7_9MYRT|nr:hypothetical protein MLD38_016760 [Melastoma candidum]